MGHLKLASVVLAFAAVSLAVGTGAFSAASADRGVEVAVVDDEQAMLGIDGGPHAFRNGNEVRELLTVTNRFSESVTVTIEIDEPGGKSPKLMSGGARTVALSPGDSHTIDPKIQCSSTGGTALPRSETWNVSVTAEGDSVHVDTEAELEVVCTGEGKGQGESGSPERTTTEGTAN